MRPTVTTLRTIRAHLPAIVVSYREIGHEVARCSSRAESKHAMVVVASVRLARVFVSLRRLQRTGGTALGRHRRSDKVKEGKITGRCPLLAWTPKQEIGREIEFICRVPTADTHADCRPCSAWGHVAYRQVAADGTRDVICGKTGGVGGVAKA